MTVDAPEPMDERDAGLDARIRLKLDRGEPLDAEERAFLATLPASKEIPPGDVQ